MKTNTELVNYCVSKANKKETIYVLGAYGQTLTPKYVNNICVRHAFNKANKSFIWKHMGYQAFDCCGLIKAFLWDDNPNNYNAKQDRNDAMMLSDAREKGPISTMPEIPGLLVFMTGHVGVYVGGGFVVECAPRTDLGGWGVIRTKLKGRGWTSWAKHIDIDYKKQAPVVQEEKVDQILHRGSKVVLKGTYEVVSVNAKANTCDIKLNGAVIKNVPCGPLTEV